MKPSLLILAAATVVALSSCSSAYKTGQTPDDLYFSPAKANVQDEYVSTPRQNDRMYQGSDEYYEDRFLRMRAANPYRWSYLDDYYFSSPYGYNAFRYSDPWGWNSPWNNYWSWNYYYNPYYGGFHPGWYAGGGWGWGGYYGPGVIVIGGSKVPRAPISRPVAFTPNSYGVGTGNSGRSYNTSNNRMMNSYRGSNFQGYNNTNSGNYRTNGRGYNSNNNSYNNSNSTPSRSYTPSSSGSGRSSGSGSSGSGGGVSRPGRR